MSFQQGLSGLNGAAKSLDVIGNNIANASTVGFKGSQAQFADVYANSLNGTGGNQAGIGTKVAQIAQQFTQGNVESSANPLDIAINGGGFFRTTVSGATQYSRNGQFSLDKNGYIVNAQGAQLTGSMAKKGVIQTGAPIPIQISNADLTPEMTKTVNTEINLDSRSAVPANATFSVDDPASFNKQTSIDVYDTLGNSHVMSTYYVRTATGWNVNVANDGVAVPGAPQGTLTFGTDGALLTPKPATLPIILPIDPLTGAANPLNVVMDFTGTTQYGAAFNERKSSQDGYSAGQLTRFSADSDGVILGQYSNGQSQKLGQIVLANFANPNGLSPLGNNAWAETSASGVPLIGEPNSGSLGVLQASAVENSNVDLTAELVNMITAQRVYQANAQTIKTQDSVLQTLVSLR
jgi:flagellar hook protein FlgE